jgi:C1A family cysteine protease
MKKTIVALFVMLLMVTIVSPLIGSTDEKIEYDQYENQILNKKYINDDCRCNSNNFYKNEFSVMNNPLIAYNLDEEITMHIMNDLPDYFNWRDYDGKDWTTPAKAQSKPRGCGSCWDFAALGALESVIKIKEDLPDLIPDLSEQYVLSCLPAAANTYGQGCDGGDSWKTYRFIYSNSSLGNYCNGVILESCMPYQADHNVPCEEKSENWEEYLVPITDYGQNWWRNHEETTLDQIKTRIIEGGPVVGGINTTNDFYKWGTSNHDLLDYYPDPHENWSNYINHLIVIVGWKDDDTIGNGGYWICKNSWGDIWGYDGFFNIEYGALFTGWLTVWVEYNPEDFDWPPIPQSNGPYYGLTNEEFQFYGDAEGENPPFSWFWDFGDGLTSTEQNPTHTYTNPGEYPVTLTVTGDNGDSLTDETFTWIQDANQPPSTPEINGPSEIKKGEYCWYNFQFSDPDGSSVYLYFHVFGYESGNWLGPYSPEDSVENINDCWLEEGDYIVKAKAKDPYGAESDWATLEVTVTKSKSISDFYPWISRLIERFPILKLLI